MREALGQVDNQRSPRRRRAWNKRGAEAAARPAKPDGKVDRTPRTPAPQVTITHQHVAVTAIECGEIVVTVSSRFIGDDRSSAEIRPMPYVTSIAGGPMSGWSWSSRTWSKALHNHMQAVGLVGDMLATGQR